MLHAMTLLFGSCLLFILTIVIVSDGFVRALENLSDHEAAAGEVNTETGDVGSPEWRLHTSFSEATSSREESRGSSVGDGEEVASSDLAGGNE